MIAHTNTLAAVVMTDDDDAGSRAQQSSSGRVSSGGQFGRLIRSRAIVGSRGPLVVRLARFSFAGGPRIPRADDRRRRPLSRAIGSHAPQLSEQRSS